MEPEKIRKKRALSSEKARIVRQRGHNDALEFALQIGLTRDYQNDRHAKKDVIDPSGEAHSVKSGEKKWQIFLYRQGRFEDDLAFRVMNGIGELCIRCIEAFPPTFEEYQKDKASAKEKLRMPMRELAEKLQNRNRLKAFLEKSLFNGGEVKYLTVKIDNRYHVFLNRDVIKVLGDKLEVCNSRAISNGQFPEQKVLFRFDGTNVGEFEMRNDSQIHYREIRFNMIKPKVMKLLFENIPHNIKYNDFVLVYGRARLCFGRWRKSK